MLYMIMLMILPSEKYYFQANFVELLLYLSRMECNSDGTKTEISIFFALLHLFHATGQPSMPPSLVLGDSTVVPGSRTTFNFYPWLSSFRYSIVDSDWVPFIAATVTLTGSCCHILCNFVDICGVEQRNFKSTPIVAYEILVNICVPFSFVRTNKLQKFINQCTCIVRSNWVSIRNREHSLSCYTKTAEMLPKSTKKLKLKFAKTKFV